MTRFRFEDFAPRVGPDGAVERVEDAVERANDWVAANRVTVFNVETVVLPTESPDSHDGGWLAQVVRVWFTAGGDPEDWHPES